MVDASSNASSKITFFSKNTITCPVCGTEFKREEMFTGRGRLNAGAITEELRRVWLPGKYGLINPLLYPITVCPSCFFSVLCDDFGKLKEAGKNVAVEETARRQATIKKLFGFLDFTLNRQIEHGAASYLLAVQCYTYMDKYASPTLKKAICAMRAGWLFSDLENEYPEKEFGSVSLLFYRKALGFYNDALYKQQRAEESFDGIKSYGPDTEDNFRYEGVLYLIAYLTMKLGYLTEDIQKRKNDYESAKRLIAKMFGSGRASKEKSSTLLDMTRDLYDEFGVKIAELDAQLGIAPPAEATPAQKPSK